MTIEANLRAKNKKIPDSGARVLEVLKALSKQPLSSAEILSLLEEKSNKIFRKEIVPKYLNTIKLLGIKISKHKNKYYLDKSISCIDFSKTDLSMLKFIEKYATALKLRTLDENLDRTLQVIEKNFSKQTEDLYKNTTIRAYYTKKVISAKNDSLQKFEKYCKDGLKIELTYKPDKNLPEQIYKISPIKILYKKGNAVLIAYDCVNNVYKEFIIDFITHSQQSPQKNSRDFTNSVTFKLKDRLAKSYILKEGEKILEYGKDFIVVSNRKEDRDMLTRRLARYFDKCEVLYPQDMRQKMIDYINNIEKLYQ